MALHKKTVDWYHKMIFHQGETHTEHTFRQHFYWKGLCTIVHEVCQKCLTCQRAETTNQEYGKLPYKQAETNFWDTLCVYLIGPYTIPWKGKNPLKLWCLTMIYPSTVWFKIAQILNKPVAGISDNTKNTWCTCYPLLQLVVFGHGIEFMAELSKMCQNYYGLKSKPITTRNPQPNTITKWIHQIGNQLKTSFDMSNIV